MIKKLNNSNAQTAKQICTTFQRSYKVEAQLIGVVDFPPLLRSAKDIEHSDTSFYGFIVNTCLAAVIEVTIKDMRLEIDSLTVDPDYFKQGIASKLISYVLEIGNFPEAMVETAVANTPAINLYSKHGFIEFKRWTPSHGIQKLAMKRKIEST